MRTKKPSQLGKKIRPYLYLSPTIILMIVLLVIPICLIITYSFQNNAVVTKNPVFVGLYNYEKILKDKEFRNAVVTTIIFVSVNVVAHVSLGMCFALLLNAKELKSGTKTVARVIYVLPWVFTASVVAILWKLMLQPSGIVNYLLQFFGLATKDTAWLSERKTALGALLFVSIWNGYPFYI